MKQLLGVLAGLAAIAWLLNWGRPGAANLYAQIMSNDFSQIDGTVERSELLTYETRPGRKYNTWIVRVRYNVAGEARTLESERFLDRPSRWERTVNGLVAAHPVGSGITVHYDPADPSHAVLFPGCGVLDFVNPAGFVVMLTGAAACAAAFARSLYRRVAGEQLAGIHSEESATRSAISCSSVEPLAYVGTLMPILAGVLTLILSLFGRAPVGVFMGAAVFLVAVLIVASVWLWRLCARRMRSDESMLLFDHAAKTVRFPVRGREPSLTVPTRNVTGFDCKEDVSRSARQKIVSYTVFARLSGGGGPREMATATREWCQRQLGRGTSNSNG